MLSTKQCQQFFLDSEHSLDVPFETDMSEKKERNPHAVHLGQLGGRLGAKDLLLKGAGKSLEKPHWHGGQNEKRKGCSPTERVQIPS